MKSRVLVLGAGFGGMELASLLSESLGEGADVTVIDKGDHFVFGYSKLDVMFGKKPLDAVRLPYSRFAPPGVRLVRETITAIDPQARRVTTDGGSYSADFLVVALGADLDVAATPGLAEGGNEFYSVPGATLLRDVLPDFSAGPAIVGICGFPYKCPPGPSECALTLHHYLSERGVRGACEITLVSPLSSPMPASAEMSKAMMAAFAETGIRVMLQTTVTALDPDRKVALLDDGSALPYALFLGVPKHRAPQVVRDSGLAEGDWVPIDLATMATAIPCVYAIGDMAKTGHPKAGSFAESQAEAVASAIIAQVTGGQAHTNKGTGSCHIEFGDGRIARADVDFLTGPKLRATYQPPSLDSRAHKDAFDADRRSRWFGL
ncbi:NAD(P)/FAD-dependent oxidoreductase [Antarctobacter heliothermus]|uniref:Sulfide:quinone oxidoreductase n=1 Tax=Antarctobacter heliothermus TaxID=74033 RepID=A0A239DY47_9RHOB|nr:FAD-dependent oxidoreductase [Antarctobacter heliothermus]SNS37267.1 sulfide:quinone oxidoreductase [Antarctobacter heliothermus]